LPVGASDAHLGGVNKETEAVPLVKRADLRESWFDGHPPRESLTSIPPPPPPKPALGRTILGGCIAGFVGGVAFVGVASLAAQKLRLGSNVARTFGTWLSRGALLDNAATYGGVVMIAGIGLVLGAFLSLATRHVRRGLPMMLFGLLFAPVVWLSLHVFVLRRFVPARAAELPFGPLVLGAAVFGACFGLLPALRGRGRS